MEVKLADPDVVSNPSEYQKLAKSMAELDEVVSTYREFKDLRAVTGGDEAGLWAGDLVGLSVSEAEKGGFKTFVMKIKGNCVYSKLKYESGVHRVQRVPQTEAQGRVHTSTDCSYYARAANFMPLQSHIFFLK
ncbi:hypothetical protein Syun_028914 [Stephania yunnanensis]|uniref:Peptide chain release factor domain-containing protein n=1 Tax=Stephania yunnanensis TaxID=152371 RepID=A0AAP0HKW6_9MAGN